MVQPVGILRDAKWERQVGESALAFAAFTVYLNLGPSRTVPDAYRQAKGKPTAKQAPGTWNGWAVHWRWFERAAAWDAFLDQQARDAEAQAEREAAEQRARARAEQRLRELHLGDELLQRVEEMLRLPVVEVRVERDLDTGRVTQHFMPSRWRLADTAALARVGVELRRLGLDMQTDSDRSDLASILARVLKHAALPSAGDHELTDDDLTRLDHPAG